MLLILGLIVFIVLFALMGLMSLSQKKMLTPESVLTFTKESPSKVSFAMHYNGKSIGSVNPLQAAPLVNSSNLIIAIEYAHQAAKGKIDAEQLVSFDDIEAFHIPKLEGDLHREWIAQMKQARYKKDVPLREVAKGMLQYNSFANAEYLMHVLGIAEINEQLRKLKMTKHDPIYPTASALYVEDQHATLHDYRKQATAIHAELLKSPKSAQQKNAAKKNAALKTWAEHLPKGSAKDYVSLVKKLNNATLFGKEIYSYLMPLLDGLLTAPKAKKEAAHGAQFLSLTASAVNGILYTTDHAGNRLEMAIFLYNLTPQEQMKLSMSVNNFFDQVVTDPVFRERIKMQANK